MLGALDGGGLAVARGGSGGGRSARTSAAEKAVGGRAPGFCRALRVLVVLRHAGHVGAHRPAVELAGAVDAGEEGAGAARGVGGDFGLKFFVVVG